MRLSAESQYIVGVASQQDPLQAEVRLTRLGREAVALEARRRTIRYVINALLHRSPIADRKSVAQGASPGNSGDP
jgi:outer membrane protein, heavy metal efflux system